MKPKKAFVAAASVAALTLGMAACGGSSDNGGGKPSCPPGHAHEARGDTDRRQRQQLPGPTVEELFLLDPDLAAGLSEPLLQPNGRLSLTLGTGEPFQRRERFDDLVKRVGSRRQARHAHRQ